MEFISYHQIKQSTDPRTLREAQELGDVKWIVTEKIHGCNFSLSFDGSETQASSRNRVLTDGDGFYQWKRIKEESGQALKSLWLDICDQQPKPPTMITVFGEIFGPGVQKGVLYLDKVVFSAFDLVVDGIIKSPDTSRPRLERCGFSVAPLIGHFSEINLALAIDPKFKSLINLNASDDNFAEGYVVSPCIDVPDEDYRVIFKMKSAAFLEKSKAPKKKKKPADISDADQETISEMLTYLTEQRFHAVRSKELEGTHPFKLAALLIRDLISDWKSETDGTLPPSASRVLMAEAKPLVSEWIKAT